MSYKELDSYKYAMDVVGKRIIACEWVIWECQRFLDDLKKQEDEDYPYYFDVESCNKLDAFTGLFKYVEGMAEGEVMKLAPFQSFAFHNIEGWKVKKNGATRFRMAYLQWTRKSGKSIGLGLYDLYKAFTTKYGQMGSCGTSRDQASVIINEISKILDTNPKIRDKYFKIYKNKEKANKIVCLKTQCSIEAFSSEAGTLEGKGMDVGNIDEFALHNDRSVIDSLITSNMYKANATILQITTAQPSYKNPAKAERDILVKQMQGKLPVDERYFHTIYELDDAEKEINDFNMWGKAIPLLLDFPISKDNIIQQYETAKNNPSALMNFKAKNLNIWQQGESLNSYVDIKKWNMCVTRNKLDFTGLNVYLGLDGSIKGDITSLVMIADDVENNRYLVKNWNYLPSVNLIKKQATDKVDYTSFSQRNNKEWLTIIEGEYIHRNNLADRIRSIEDEYGCRIVKASFDSFKVLDLMSDLKDEYVITDCKMTMANFSPVLKQMRELILDKAFLVEYNPILDVAVGNAIEREDKGERILLDKQKSEFRIDPIVAMGIAYSEIFYEGLEEEEDDTEAWIF